MIFIYMIINFFTKYYHYLDTYKDPFFMYQKLTVEELGALKKARLSLLANMVVMAILFYIVIPVLVYFVLNFSFSYSWIYLMGSTLLLVGIAIRANKNLNMCSRDIKAGVKVSGKSQIDRKHKITLKGNSKCWLFFQMEGPRKVEVSPYEYHQFEEGDKIFVEFAEKSQKVFTLEKV